MKKIRILAFLAVICTLLGVLGLRIYITKKQPIAPTDIVFQLQTEQTECDIKLWHNYYDGKEYLFLPSFCDETTECIISTGTSSILKWDGNSLGLFRHLKEITDGEHQLQIGGTLLTVQVMHSANVPALFITTASGGLAEIEAEKGNGEPGLYTMVDADGTQMASGQLEELKSRGNATFLEDKKPYQMSLQEPADLLGSGNLENYILLANRQDRSLLRNRIMYDMAAEMGLRYSPVSRHIDLYINDEYRGSYQLSEKVEVAENRVPIDVSGKTDEPGFLVSFEYQTEDRLTPEERYFVTENGQAVVVKRPKKATSEQMEYVTGIFQQMEDAILSGDLKKAGIDETSFARKYIIEEVGKNLDAMHASQYFYKDEGEAPVYAGPVWDYDKTLGNPLIEKTRPVNFQEPKGIFAATKQENASWWYDMCQMPSFQALVEREYENSAKPAIDTMLDGRIDEYKTEIHDSAYMDYMRWDPFENFKYEEELDFEGEWCREIEGIVNFLEIRKKFLDNIWLKDKAYHQIPCNPDGGTMYVTKVDAVEGDVLTEPEDPQKEGFEISHWIVEETGEVYDFTEIYNGEPFVLKAVYEKEEVEIDGANE